MNRIEMDEQDILAARNNAQQLLSISDLEASVDRMAVEITQRINQSNPLLLAVMTGGMVPATMLLTRLDFPLEVDYIHLTRYGNNTTGGEVEWIREPPMNLSGRTVLLVDDLLDHGLTLEAAVRRCHEHGAKEVLTAVLIVKEMSSRAGLGHTDFFGLTTPVRYLFGAGMDYKGYWRNAPGVFALSELTQQ